MKKKILLRLILSSIILSILILSFYVYLTNIKNGSEKHKFNTSEVLPKIKEHYSKTSLNVYKSYNDLLYYDENNDEIIMSSNDDNISHYIIGKFSKIYTNPIEIKRENDIYENNPDYLLINTEEDEIYIKRPTNLVVNDYDDINAIYHYENRKIIYDYLVLKKNNKITLLNLKNYDMINIDDDIDIIQNNSNYSRYIIINKSNKYGLMDNEGNIILEPTYDYLYNLVDKDEYVALKDNKYGIINSRNEIILNFEYDDITYIKDYKILRKSNKIGVYYNNKQIVDYVISYYENDNNYEIENPTIYQNNDNIYLISVYPSSINSTTFWNNSKAYYITKKGVIRRIDSFIECILDENDNIEYFYSLRENSGNINITFYDKDFFEYYTFTIPYNKAYDYEVIINKIKNTNYYEVNIEYSNSSLNKTYYVDLFNSKEVNEKTALIKYFDNGYSFTLNSDNVLKVYKDNELLDEYSDIYYYFGGYYFYKNKTIYTLEFKKDS